jgi:O-antigen ligase
VIGPVLPVAALPPLEGAALLGAAVSAAAAMVARPPRLRAAAVLLAGVLAPLALLGQLGETPILTRLADRPVAVAAGGLLAVALLTAVALLIGRRPAAFAPLAAAALPFRLPLDTGGESADLLLPLYGVVAAGGIVFAVERLRLRPRHTRPGAFAEPGPGRSHLALALALALVLYALQALFSPDPGPAVKNVAFFYVPFAILFTLLGGVRWTPRLLLRTAAVLAGLALALAAIGAMETATQTLLITPKGTAPSELETYFRASSIFLDPNIFGRFLVMVVLLLGAVILWSRERRAFAAATAAVAALWGGLVLTFSQTSFVALMAGLAVLAGLRWGARPVLAGGAVALAVGLVALVAGAGLLRIDLGDPRSVDRATSGRADLVAGAVGLWAERPLAGHGSGSFSVRFREREGVTSEQAVSASHTTPLTVAAEQGLIGLAVFAALVTAALGVLFRGLGAPRTGSPVGALAIARTGLAAAFVALLAHTLAYAAFLEDPLTWALLGVGLALAPSRAERATRAAAAPPGRAGAPPEPSGAPARRDAVAPGPSAAARRRTGSSSR